METSVIKEMQGWQKVHVPGVVGNYVTSGFVVGIIFSNPVILK